MTVGVKITPDPDILTLVTSGTRRLDFVAWAALFPLPVSFLVILFDDAP